MSDPHLDSSSELGRLVASARADAPTTAALERMAAGLPVGPPPAAPSGGAGLGVAAKLAIAVGISLGLGAGGYAIFGGEEAPSAAPRFDEAPERAEPTEEPRVVAPGASALPAEAQSAEPEPVPEPPQKASKAAVPSEASILERARRSLGTNPAAALGATREHKRLYPNGVLAQEREVIAIEALKRLKRESEAKSRADAFETEHPESAHQRKVESILEK